MTAEISPGLVVLLDPEGNQNIQRLDDSSLDDIRMIPPKGGRPSGVPAAERIKGFEVPLVGQALTDALVLGEDLARAERRDGALEREKELKDLRIAVAAAKAKPATPARKPAADVDASDEAETPPKGGSKTPKDGLPDGQWLVAENRDGLPFGSESESPPKAKLARRGLVPGDTGEAVLVEWVLSAELDAWLERTKPKEVPVGGIETPKGTSDDARVLPLVKNVLGEYQRDWRDIAVAMEEVEVDSWAIAGPRVTAWAVRFLRRRAMPPTDHHRWWVSICDLLPTDWGVAEHGSCLWIVELMGSHDQFDLPNCVSAEALIRQYRERVKDGSRGTVSSSPSISGSAPLTADEFDLFEGAGKVAATLMVAPQLIAYISEETKKEADITKASRKAREEKLMARTGMSAMDVSKIVATEAAVAGGAVAGAEGSRRTRGNRRKTT